MFKLKVIIAFFLFSISKLPLFSQSANCEVVKYLTYYEVKKEKLIETDSIVIQINNRSGERYTQVRIPYSKNQRISDLDAWIEDETGTMVRRLKSGDVEDKSNISDFSLYEDDFVKTFQLKHNTYPYAIKYTYKIATKDFISVSWGPVLYSSIPTKFAKLTFIALKNYQIKKYTHNALVSKTDTLENTIQYTWESNYEKPISSEIYSPSKESMIPYVMITPIHFIYGVEGSCENWTKFGNWNYRLIKDLDVLPDDEKAKLSELIKGIKDKKQIVKVLYHYLQDHTRYINVTMGIGGLKPYTASYVSQNKYGDCKALSNFMKALLKQVGITSFYTVIYRGDESREIQKDFPGPQYFNHAILTVPLDKDTIWLENTSEIGPFGYVGPDIQHREALLIDEFDSKIIRMPVLTKQDVTNKWKFDINFNEVGHADIEMKAMLKGDEFEYFNQLKSELNKDEQDEIIRNTIRISNFDLLRWDLAKPHRDSAKIDLMLRLTQYKVLKALGDEKYFSTFRIGVPLFSKPKERTNPVEIPHPICNIDSIIYHLPAGYEIKSVPEKIKVSSVYGNYECLVELQGSVINVIKIFELFPGAYSLAEYAEFYKFISTVNEKENTKILIKKKI